MIIYRILYNLIAILTFNNKYYAKVNFYLFFKLFFLLFFLHIKSYRDYTKRRKHIYVIYFVTYFYMNNILSTMIDFLYCYYKWKYL